jgi:hypothetical protein
VPVQRRYLPTSLILLGRPLAVLKAWFLSVLHPTIHQAWAIEICNCATRGCQYLFDLVHHRSIVFWHFRLSSLPAFSPCPPERPVLATPVTNWQSHFCPGLGRLSGLSYSPLVSSSSITIAATTTLSTGSYAHSGTQARRHVPSQTRSAGSPLIDRSRATAFTSSQGRTSFLLKTTPPTRSITSTTDVCSLVLPINSHRAITTALPSRFCTIFD